MAWMQFLRPRMSKWHLGLSSGPATAQVQLPAPSSSPFGACSASALCQLPAVTSSPHQREDLGYHPRLLPARVLQPDSTRRINYHLQRPQTIYYSGELLAQGRVQQGILHPFHFHVEGRQWGMLGTAGTARERSALDLLQVSGGKETETCKPGG